MQGCNAVTIAQCDFVNGDLVLKIVDAKVFAQDAQHGRQRLECDDLLLGANVEAMTE